MRVNPQTGLNEAFVEHKGGGRWEYQQGPINASIGDAKVAGNYGYTSIHRGIDGTVESAVSPTGERVPFVGGKSPAQIAQEQAAAIAKARPKPVSGLLNAKFDENGHAIAGIDEATGQQMTMQGGRMVGDGKHNPDLVARIKNGQTQPATGNPAAPAATAAPNKAAPDSREGSQEDIAAALRNSPSYPNAVYGSGSTNVPRPQGIQVAPGQALSVANGQTVQGGTGGATVVPVAPHTPGGAGGVAVGQFNVDDDVPSYIGGENGKRFIGTEEAARNARLGGTSGSLAEAGPVVSQANVPKPSSPPQFSPNWQGVPAQTQAMLTQQYPGLSTAGSPENRAFVSTLAASRSDGSDAAAVARRLFAPGGNPALTAAPTLGPNKLPAPQGSLTGARPGEVDPLKNLAFDNKYTGLSTGVTPPVSVDAGRLSAESLPLDDTTKAAGNSAVPGVDYGSLSGKTGLSFGVPKPLNTPGFDGVMKPEDFAGPTSDAGKAIVANPALATVPKPLGDTDNDFSLNATRPAAPTQDNLFSGTGYKAPPSQVDSMQKQTDQDAKDEETRLRSMGRGNY